MASKIISIRVQINDKIVELTPDEARSLYEALRPIIGD